MLKEGTFQPGKLIGKDGGHSLLMIIFIDDNVSRGGVASKKLHPGSLRAFLNCKTVLLPLKKGRKVT